MDTPEPIRTEYTPGEANIDVAKASRGSILGVGVNIVMAGGADLGAEAAVGILMLLPSGNVSRPTRPLRDSLPGCGSSMYPDSNAKFTFPHR